MIPLFLIVLHIIEIIHKYNEILQLRPVWLNIFIVEKTLFTTQIQSIQNSKERISLL